MSEAVATEQAAQPITQEAVKGDVETPAAAPDTNILSRQLGNVLGHSDALQQQVQEQQQLAAVQAELESTRQLAKTDPIKFLEESGHTLESLKELEGGSGLAEKVSKEIRELRDMVTKQQEEAEQRNRDAELNSVKQGVVDWVSKNAESYPLINAAGVQELVFQKMINSFQNGAEISEDRAASEVEASLLAFAKKAAPLINENSNETVRSEPTTLSAALGETPGGQPEKELVGEAKLAMLLKKHNF